MTIRNLSLAIMLGLGTVSSPVLISQAYAADMETQQIAEQVKARIAKLNQINSQGYQRFFNHYPAFENITFKTGDYKQTDTGMEATSTATITLNPHYTVESANKDIEITLKENIVFNNELLDQGILARIDSEIVMTDSLATALNEYDVIADKEQAEEIKKVLEYLLINTELKDDGEIAQQAQVKPFEYSEDGTKAQFDGLTVTSQYNEENAIDGVGNAQFKFGKLVITEDQGGESGAQESFTVHPFSVDYTLDEDGDLKLDSTPVKIDSSEDNFRFNIERITGKGEDVRFNDELGTFTGEQEYVFDKVTFESDNMPGALVFDSIHMTSDTEKDGDNFDFESEIVIDVDGESLTRLTGPIGLEVEDIKFKADLDDVSAATFRAFNYGLPAAQSEDEIEKIMQPVLADLAKNQSGITTELSINTDQGDATFVANIKAKSDAVSDMGQWKQAMEAEQPTAAINLLRKSFDFDIKVTIPESLVKATGAEGLMAMGAGYVVKDGSDYTLHVENSDDGIKLNGNIMPLPEDEAAQ